MSERLRVLVIEDNFLVSESIRNILEEVGYVVSGTFNNAASGIDFIRENPVDAVIMDIRMPGMDGITATRKIQEETPVPVVLLSAYDNRDLAMDASEAGAGAYLVKPPRPDELDRAILIARARFDDMMQLRRAKKQLETLFNGMQDFVFAIDLHGKILMTNHIMCEQMGWSVDEFRQKTLFDLHPASDTEEIRSLLVDMLSSRIISYTMPMLTRDGRKLITETRVSHGYWDNREVMFCVSRDITEKQKLIDRLEKSVDTRNKLLTIISHDMRNSIGSLNLAVQLLMEDYDNINRDARISLLCNISRESNDIYNLMENLLAWTRNQSDALIPEPVTLRLDEVVNAVVDQQLSVAHSKDIELVQEIPEGLMVRADRNMLQTILRNLISNSIKFTREGGSVHIHTTDGKDGSIVVHVEDTGVGIPHERMISLFSSAVNTSTPGTRSEKGSGMGLMLCHDFVKAMGGRIWASGMHNGQYTSTTPSDMPEIGGPENGTRFSFTLSRPSQ